VVDRQRGEVRFGDGIKGRIPPVAANNIRLRKYQTGGGLLGNKPAGSITQLRTSVAYVSSVANLEPAFGGQDIEDWDSVSERGSRWLRHRGRAVTREDYEDLAMLASPVVARAKCYPNLDLARDPTGGIEMPGVVSLVVVPHSPDPRPGPDLNLLHHIAKFMNGRRVADTELIVLAPQYVQVNVEAVIVATGADTGAAAVTQCKHEISRYLHPLTGGGNGRGWEFGRLPHESDLYAILEAIRELEYVRSLNIRMIEEGKGLLQSKKFLIYAGAPKIQLRM
jgi:predicted phage baseplate assembly protein